MLYRGAGLEGVYLCNGFKREEIDGEWFTHVEDIDGLHNAIALHLVAQEARLTGPEFRFIRHTMDKTQAEIAQAMSVDDQTIARWEKGKTHEVPGPADKMLRIMFVASFVGPELLLDYIREVQEIQRKQEEAERPAFTFGRDPETKEWGVQEALGSPVLESLSD